MTSIEHNNDSPAERLVRMKSEFLTARQRRLDRSHHPALGPNHSGDGPTQAVPGDGVPGGIAVVRPDPQGSAGDRVGEAPTVGGMPIR